MMKKFLPLFLLTLLCLCARSQSVSGSLKELAQSGRAKLEFDYSEVQIHGMSEEEFGDYEPQWYKDKNIVMGEFQVEFGEELEGILVCNRSIKSPFIVIVKILTINQKGDTVLDLQIVKENENGTKETLATISGIKEDGGTFGTKMNLIKDGAEHVGEKAGIFLKKELKKALKAK